MQISFSINLSLNPQTQISKIKIPKPKSLFYSRPLLPHYGGSSSNAAVGTSAATLGSEAEVGSALPLYSEAAVGSALPLALPLCSAVTSALQLCSEA
ncbi:hypothetical protein ZOSMA_105G00550 [Zostera marina]|uniref:Uncharacterized protein n=1 Tax=Zostera marina TaxID=29655 RepID=A0A0K9Q662_ZOSMR|nr:hypothetical protein ZOSMA_105G00550 [Zostera marina]